MSHTRVESKLTEKVVDYHACSVAPPLALPARREVLPEAEAARDRPRSELVAIIHFLVVMRALLGIWSARRRERQSLAELAASDDRLLRDIGVSRAAARREASKPFWRR